MYEDAVLVVLVVGVAREVGASVDHAHLLAGTRETLGHDATGVARAYHQDVGFHNAPPRNPNKPWLL
jgi:hypothetical protein